ncbi:RNA polymerase sigma factor for flagellar operon FliA [Actinoplanes campanulatus]|uniref:RNA polymerase sigma factor for flagellar operon FliA n=1 Tax=Actinoplanes campanulatus TaxID=113559 RepID=A0A7W5AAW8_9ACTN|nr:sigma-70 family RNA polymerase sigma factor [Actinoplanes campanulatus]MBB3092569.1 RNA polymerase sigma factor for flagellar operon FliA [Actinoplanes campanulatus]GGM97479.1 RNA polymerase sigma factor WhiG [Actinoplanes campanulatus]GID34336.1 RNA polymerase sigma factor WhiG [Actinoplanes campanulatus]
MSGEGPFIERRGEERRGEDIVRANMPLVGHLVREMLARVPSHVNRDDLLSAGYAALVSAARGFDAERGVPFARFAAARVRGALLDELRGLDWASRSVRQRARRVDAAREGLMAELGRTPTVQEVADRLGCTVEDIEHGEGDVHRATVFSLQGFATATADDIVTEPGAGPEEMLLRRERFGYLRHAVEALPERLRTVVQGYFFEERPMVQIAADLGVSESRVSQLRAEALVLLRDGLNTHLDPAMAAESPAKEGCVARRRAAYYDKIASRGTLRTRLALTGPDGLPLAA